MKEIFSLCLIICKIKPLGIAVSFKSYLDGVRYGFFQEDNRLCG